MPHDSHETIHLRSGVPLRTVDDMLEGQHVRVGLADGHLTEPETLRIVAALAEARTRLDMLLGALGARA